MLKVRIERMAEPKHGDIWQPRLFSVAENEPEYQANLQCGVEPSVCKENPVRKTNLVRETNFAHDANYMREANSVCKANLMREVKLEHKSELEYESNFEPCVEVLKCEDNMQPHVKHLKCKAKASIKDIGCLGIFTNEGACHPKNFPTPPHGQMRQAQWVGPVHKVWLFQNLLVRLLMYMSTSQLKELLLSLIHHAVVNNWSQRY